MLHLSFVLAHPVIRLSSVGRSADHQLGENGAAPGQWGQEQARGGTNVRFESHSRPQDSLASFRKKPLRYATLVGLQP